jgi:uncharacterized protein YndB with AHSA1/START domain
MIAKNSSAPYATIDNDLIFTRVINAKPNRVFKAFTDPKQLAQWWGPIGFTNPVCENDARPGGKRHIIMQSPEGAEFPMTGVYREVVENKRLVIVDSVAEHNQEWHAMVNKNRPNAKGDLPELVWTLTFEDLGDKTQITICYHFEVIEDRDALIKLGMTEGWSQSLDKLEGLLRS